MTNEYYYTGVPSPDATEHNPFSSASPYERTVPTWPIAKSLLPRPHWPSNPAAVECYWRAWEIAVGNIIEPAPESRNIAPYLDTAYNGNLFMWDSAFITFFARYGRRAYPFQETLDNFYARQHSDGFICRELRPDGTDAFERHDPSSTGPDVLGWNEWEYYVHTGDLDRLARVFRPLLAYHRWLMTNRTWKDGTYFSSGWGSGMDNQPRLSESAHVWWQHDHMSWLDTTVQAILSAKVLVRIAEELDGTQHEGLIAGSADLGDLVAEIEALTRIVQTRFWDPATGFFYDVARDGTRRSAKSIGAFWTLLARAVPDVAVERFVSHLTNPDEFAREHPVPSLSADDPAYRSAGAYWRGSVWAPTNYMVLRGLAEYGYNDLAGAIAERHLRHVVAVFEETGTFWENYAPDAVCPGNESKDEFVGWTGLVPITVLFEQIFGIKPNAPDGSLVWDIRLTDEFGVDDFPIGGDGTASFRCSARSHSTDTPVVHIEATRPIEVHVRWPGGGHERIVAGNETAVQFSDR